MKTNRLGIFIPAGGKPLQEIVQTDRYTSEPTVSMAVYKQINQALL